MSSTSILIKETIDIGNGHLLSRTQFGSSGQCVRYSKSCVNNNDTVKEINILHSTPSISSIQGFNEDNSEVTFRLDLEIVPTSDVDVKREQGNVWVTIPRNRKSNTKESSQVNGWIYKEQQDSSHDEGIKSKDRIQNEITSVTGPGIDRSRRYGT